MSAEMYYVVRFASTGHSEKFTSRPEAERLVTAGEGRTIHRVTVTTEDVGLRWEERPCRGACRHWKLVDGDEFIGTVNTDAEGNMWFVFLGWGGFETDGPFDTIEEAKAAAEAAVRETWT